MKTTTLILGACLLIEPIFAGVTNITSHAYYDNIADAVTGASSGDHLLISTGVYNETVPINGINLSLDGKYNADFSAKAGSGSTVVDGGGLASVFNVVNGASVYLQDLELTGGSASGGQGGGLRVWEGSTAIVVQCNIYSNFATFGGGVYLRQHTLVVLTNTTVQDNIATNIGGGIFVNGGTLALDGDNSNIKKNYAPEGGGIGVDHGTATIQNSADVYGNSAYYGGGGAYCNRGGSFSDCTISGNSADSGGGAFCYSGGALTNCLIYNMNSATFGGGAYLNNGGELYNCTIVGNYASDNGGGICTSNGGTIVNTIIYDNQAFSGNNNWLNYLSGAIFNYCCTTPTNGLPGGNECISDNPIFVAPGSDYHLIDGSPCIDAGTNMAWMTGATDLDGNPRIYGSTVDMGCYEFIPEPVGIWIIGILECWIVGRRKFNQIMRG